MAHSPISRHLGPCLALALSLPLLACGDTVTDYPKLAPTDQLLAPPAIPAHAQEAAAAPERVRDGLEAEGRGLKGRAAATGSRPVDNRDLTARAAALRARAEALKQADVPSGGASMTNCPEGQTDCAAPAKE
ncbi:hypothetical protein [Paracoccus aminophilus]|uniref:Lipoprotein n=1 Tax=Paracoccus aminophilus JCM 7686 TaxID=1367847 RepID=S5YVM5_PARAH|nr:hypothetical protein [Paracoccus aminophilus]AGT09286.1 hypothetical protein JCM7686_2207 [Paracoccus aminophilus JCM 7686]